jgi:hypothetical protein
MSAAAADLNAAYDPAAMEQRWQSAWRAVDAFATPMPGDQDANVYIFVAPPFTSGDIHMGHVRSYTLADAVRARTGPLCPVRSRLRCVRAPRRAGSDRAFRVAISMGSAVL